MAEDWGKIVEKVTLPDGTRVLFWSAGIAYVEWAGGGTTNSVNATRDPVGAEWDMFHDATLRVVESEIARKAAKGAPATSARQAVIGVGRPVFGVTPPPPGAVGKGRRYSDRRGK